MQTRTDADLLIGRLPETRITTTYIRAFHVDTDAVRTHSTVLAFIHICVVRSPLNVIS